MALVDASLPGYRQVFRLGRYASARAVELLTYTDTPAPALFLSQYTSFTQANLPPIPLVRRLPDLPLVHVDPELESGTTIE